MMRLRHLEIFVKDPLASLAFYRDALGFDVEEIQGDSIVWLIFGSSSLLLRPGANAPQAESYQRAPIALVMYTNELDAARAHLVCRNGELQRGGVDHHARRA